MSYNYFENKNMIYWAKVKPEALIPKKERENAGYDIFATFEEDFIIIYPFSTGIIPTGIAWASDCDYYLQIEERSSTGLRGIKTSGGVIDSGYRGEIKVTIFNANDKPLVFSAYSEDKVKNILLNNIDKYKVDVNNFIFYSTSKAIAQGIVHRVEDMQTKEISLKALQEIPSMRGDNAWGSSNKN